MDTLGHYTPVVAIGQAISADGTAHRQADTIWKEFIALDRFRPLLTGDYPPTVQPFRMPGMTRSVY